MDLFFTKNPVCECVCGLEECRQRFVKMCHEHVRMLVLTVVLPFFVRCTKVSLVFETIKEHRNPQLNGLLHTCTHLTSRVHFHLQPMGAPWKP